MYLPSFFLYFSYLLFTNILSIILNRFHLLYYKTTTTTTKLKNNNKIKKGKRSKKVCFFPKFAKFEKKSTKRVLLGGTSERGWLDSLAGQITHKLLQRFAPR